MGDWPVPEPCTFRVDKDIPAGPGPWVCDKPADHPPPHHLVQLPVPRVCVTNSHLCGDLDDQHACALEFGHDGQHRCVACGERWSLTKEEVTVR